jgi:sulfatase modifying factor 1
LKRIIYHTWFLLLLTWVSLPAAAQQDTVFVKIPAGSYWIGRKGHLLNPLRQVQTAGFYMAATTVTNQQFEQFALATNYRTDAERLHNALVFEPGLADFRWLEDSTACWRYPNGRSRGGIEHKMDHPVTSISYTDALAYCEWANVRLPSLEEWEIASRAGARTTYFWGDNPKEITKYANIWYGRDHLTADSTDGYMYTSPVAHFKPNSWGLYDMYGNVFEFCEGRLNAARSSRKVVHARGGSWWCSKNTCNFFNSVEIGTVHPHASFSNQGFRVVKR